MRVPELRRTTKQRYGLDGECCPHCCKTVFPPRPTCLNCRKQILVPKEVNGRTMLVAATPEPEMIATAMLAVAEI